MLLGCGLAANGANLIVGLVGDVCVAVVVIQNADGLSLTAQFLAASSAVDNQVVGAFCGAGSFLAVLFHSLILDVDQRISSNGLTAQLKAAGSAVNNALIRAGILTGSGLLVFTNSLSALAVMEGNVADSTAAQYQVHTEHIGQVGIISNGLRNIQSAQGQILTAGQILLVEGGGAAAGIAHTDQFLRVNIFRQVCIDYIDQPHNIPHTLADSGSAKQKCCHAFIS